MFKLQQNRYLWVHFVGLAAVPLLLDICLAGLASAGPALPFSGQYWAVALVGIVPATLMQFQKPFYIYSLPPLALKPSVLSEDDRRCLTVLQSWQMKALAAVTAAFCLWLLAKVYERLPLITPSMTPQSGLISAIAAFFFICLFLQISVSVVRSLLIGQDMLKRVPPFEASAITANFLILGLRVNKIFAVAKKATTITDKVRQKKGLEIQQSVAETVLEEAPKETPKIDSETVLEAISEKTIEVPEESEVEVADEIEVAGAIASEPVESTEKTDSEPAEESVEPVVLEPDEPDSSTVD